MKITKLIKTINQLCCGFYHLEKRDPFPPVDGYDLIETESGRVVLHLVHLPALLVSASELFLEACTVGIKGGTLERFLARAVKRQNAQLD